MLNENNKAPNFTLPDQNGNKISLSQFKGKKVVIFFYPKDNTPGCTKEACSIRDTYSTIKNKNTIILGISPDSTKSHQNFINKFQLPFLLLSDPEHTVIEQYNAWGEKKMYGKTYMGVLRSTFIINEAGNIIKIFSKVKPANHGSEILEFL